MGLHAHEVVENFDFAVEMTPRCLPARPRCRDRKRYTIPRLVVGRATVELCVSRSHAGNIQRTYIRGVSQYCTAVSRSSSAGHSFFLRQRLCMYGCMLGKVIPPY